MYFKTLIKYNVHNIINGYFFREIFQWMFIMDNNTYNVDGSLQIKEKMFIALFTFGFFCVRVWANWAPLGFFSNFPINYRFQFDATTQSEDLAPVFETNNKTKTC